MNRPILALALSLAPIVALPPATAQTLHWNTWRPAEGQLQKRTPSWPRYRGTRGRRSTSCPPAWRRASPRRWENRRAVEDLQELGADVRFRELPRGSHGL